MTQELIDKLFIKKIVFMTFTTPKNLLQIRTGTAADAQTCSHICYEAFTQISERHGFVPDFSHPEMTAQMMAMLFAHPKVSVGRVGDRRVRADYRRAWVSKCQHRQKLDGSSTRSRPTTKLCWGAVGTGGVS
jgi:hypothetical protein